jgi:hypothetical protein
VRRRDCGHDRQRSVAAGHPEHVRAGRRGFTGQRGQVLVPGEDDGLDPLLARPLGQPGARRLAVTGPRVDEQHRLARRISGPPAVTRQPVLRWVHGGPRNLDGRLLPAL